TTAVPAVAAAMLVARGDWNVRRMVNVEELDPDPFLAEMKRLGIDWHVREEQLQP
ncbi:MAG: saccharopine dehydrogenase, partial [Zetaproteobacteria bacterium]